jgi:hypothetical protein
MTRPLQTDKFANVARRCAQHFPQLQVRGDAVRQMVGFVYRNNGPCSPIAA